MIEQEILDRIVFIGDQLPLSLFSDERPKFVLLGTPQELIDAVNGSEEPSTNSSD